MPKIIDPDLLVVATSITPATFGPYVPSSGTGGNLIINTTAKTIQLGTGSGLDATDGVSMQALYSKLKKAWRDSETQYQAGSNLQFYDFPMLSITNEQFEFINGWDFADEGSKYLIRDGGWASASEQWMNVTTLGNFDLTGGAGTAYFTQDGTTTVSILVAGPVNQPVKIWEDATMDHRDLDGDSFFRIYLRERGKLYDAYDLFTDQNIDTLTYKKYAMPLSDSVDINWNAADTTDAIADGYGITIDWHAPTSLTIGPGGSYTFSVTIDGQGLTRYQIYNGVMSKLRKASDIDLNNTPVTLGKLADELLEFVGDILYTKQGVVILDYAGTETNSIIFTDDGGTQRQNPFTASGTLLFNSNLTTDTSPYYWMYVDSTFPGSGATYVDNAAGADIIGAITGASISFDFAWDTNSQGGRTPGVTPLDVLVVATGLDKAQYVQAAGTINRSTSNSISINAVLERNYLDPA
jgi:hypothetical protein